MIDPTVKPMILGYLSGADKDLQTHTHAYTYTQKLTDSKIAYIRTIILQIV